MGAGPGQSEQPGAASVNQVQDDGGSDQSMGGFSAGARSDSGHILKV